jgi:uncharacterized protein YdaU (DUF1376 family)
MTGAERAFYLYLIIYVAAADPGGCIPDPMNGDGLRRLARLTNYPPAAIKKLWRAVSVCWFEYSPGRLTNKRLQAELKLYGETCAKNKAAVDERWHKEKSARPAERPETRTPSPPEPDAQPTGSSSRKKNSDALAITDHPLAEEWKKQYNRYPKNTRMRLGASAFTLWMSTCAEVVTTRELVEKLKIAVDALVAENDSKTDVATPYPAYWLRDKDTGHQHWLTVAFNAEEIKASLPPPTEVLPFKIETPPWNQISYDMTEERKQEIRNKWPTGRRRKWIAARLDALPAEHHERWYAEHKLEAIPDDVPQTA